MLSTCWECKNNSLKLKVLVPHDQTIREYVHRTGNFQLDILAMIKEKRGQYSGGFRSEGNEKLVTLKILHDCKLKRDPTQKTDCACFNKSQETKMISSIIYSKLSLSESVEEDLMH